MILRKLKFFRRLSLPHSIFLYYIILKWPIRICYRCSRVKNIQFSVKILKIYLEAKTKMILKRFRSKFIHIYEAHAKDGMSLGVKLLAK